jgi:antitoxin (DNA-binding transcriptional repressor) of toxin-antitoxin stability system
MMSISLQEAETRLSEVVHNLKPGDVVTITENNQPVAQLTASTAKPRPVLGRCQGMLTILSEDDEHLNDFKDYMS